MFYGPTDFKKFKKKIKKRLKALLQVGVSGAAKRKPACLGMERATQGNMRGQHPFSMTCPTGSSAGLSVAVPIHPQQNSTEILPTSIPGYCTYTSQCLQISSVIFNWKSPFQKRVQRWPTPANFQQSLDMKLPFVLLVIRASVRKREKRYSSVTGQVTHILTISCRHFLKYRV